MANPFQFSSSTVPTWGPGVLGSQAPKWPTLPGFFATPNATNGYNYSFPNPAGARGPTTSVKPIATPPRQPTTSNPVQPVTGAPATTAPSLPGAPTPVLPPGGTAQAPMNGAHGTPTAPARTVAAWTPPPTATGQPPQVGKTGNWMGDLLSAIGSTPTNQVPGLPDLGIEDQGVKNLLAYNQWLLNNANAQNDMYWKMGLQAMQGMGQSEKTDIAQSAAQQNAANEQALMDRGLYNSTISPNLQQGVAREASRQNQRVDEGNAQMLMNWLNQRQMQGPDQNAFAEMIRAAMNRADPQLAAGNLPTGGPPITATPQTAATGAAAPGTVAPGAAAAAAPAKFQTPQQAAAAAPNAGTRAWMLLQSSRAPMGGNIVRPGATPVNTVRRY